MRKVSPQPLLRRAGAEPDEEHVARVRLVGDPEVEEVGVAVARPVRVVPVHRALQRVVEAEVARVLVLHDGEPVVARVLGEDDLEILRLDDGARVARVEVAVAARPEERRPVLGRGGGQRLDVLRAERDRVEARADGERARDRHGRVQPAGESGERGGGEERGGAENEQLLDTELGDQPEGGRERPDDAPGGRDRERPSRRAPRPLQSVGLQPHGYRPDGREQHRHRQEEDRGAENGIEAGAGIPPQHGLDHDAVEQGNGEHGRCAGSDHGAERQRRREAVGERSADPVAGREPAEDDADDRRPDEERVAEVRRQHAARGHLDPKQHAAAEKDDREDGQRRRPVVVLQRDDASPFGLRRRRARRLAQSSPR
jgi:hypothetical protein